ncbi:MAG: DUF2231 domain-containing protein [Bacteroidia bacterium]|nr:DUF2231 domain-containing protein [Bacteroidia bacterium]
MNFFSHPQFVHFPIALSIVAGIFYTVALFREREFFLRMGFFLHLGGLLGSILSILSGRSADAEVIHTQDIHDLLILHERIAYLVTWLFAMFAIWMFIRQKRIRGVEMAAFLILFWGTIITLGYMSHLGGEMVYEKGAGVEPMEESLKQERSLENNKNEADSH